MNEKEFDNVDIFTGEMPVKAPTQSGLVAIEQSRAMAEVQAAMLMARMNPRDEYTAYERIKKACRRKSLAKSAAYAYKRGTKIVTGPTIRLAEVLASHWGNMTYGLKELSRKPGSSEIEAFAWDLETNVRAVRTFVVNHIRDKSSGNVALTSERDVYELVANMGQRRVRACILELIPGDIVEAAEDQCKETLVKDEKPIEDRIREMLVVFDDMGVTREMIESYLGHKIKGIIPTQLVQLTQIYKSLKDGIAKREDFFSFDQKKEELLETIDDRFHREFLFHKHEATVAKINAGVKILVESLGLTEEKVKANILEDPGAFRAGLKDLVDKETTPPKTPEDSAGETSDPQNEREVPPLGEPEEPTAREKKIIETKAHLDSASKEQLPEFMASLKSQLDKMPLDDQSVIRDYYEVLANKAS